MTLDDLRLVSIDGGAQIPGEGQIPAAPTLTPDMTFATGFTWAVYASVALTVGWALWMWWRRGDGVPTLLFLTGVVGANLEPLGDHLGLIVYAPDLPWFNYWVMGRSMPAVILMGAAVYVCVGGYAAYRFLLTGRSVRAVWGAAAAVAVPEVIAEMVCHHYRFIDYYGDNPSLVLGIPLYTIAQNIGLLIVGGCLIVIAKAQLSRAQLGWLILAGPSVAIAYIVGCTWPAYQALQSSAPLWVTWPAVLISCGMALAVPQLLLRTRAIAALREPDVLPAPAPQTATAVR